MKLFDGIRLDAKFGVVLWVAVHAILIILGVSVPWKMDSDLYSIQPDSNEMKNVSAAEKVLGARTMRNITVLVGHENFEIARSVAVALDSAFSGDSSFDEVRFYVDEHSFDETHEFLVENRYKIQGANLREALAARNLEYLKLDAYKKIYGLFSFADLNRLEEDPFLLGEAAFDDFMQRSLMMSGRFTLREGVLATTDSNVTNVMWNAVLSENVPSMASENHVLERLNRTLDSLKKNHAGLVVAKSGIPFHSYESSSRAKAEIALISGISMVLILLLLLYVFRSTLPIVATLSTIAIAIVSALSFTWFVFGNIHVFTFIFGTSVIGVSIDYAVHFWTHWKERTLGGSRSRSVRSLIFKSLLLGFMTTEFSYLALTFADFPLLCQMAVFSMVGLLSSFLTITLLFHAVFDVGRNSSKRGTLSKSNSSRKGTLSKPKSSKLPKALPKAFLKLYSLFPKNALRLVAVLFVVALIPGLYLLNIHTDLRSLYTMSDEMKAAEVLNAKLCNPGISENYFIVEGYSEEEVLQHEELLTERLVRAEKNSHLKSHLATSDFIPSAKTQANTYVGFRQLFFTDGSLQNITDSLADSVKSYLRGIGVQNDSAFVAGLNKGLHISHLKSIINSPSLPSSFRSILKMLWIGEVGDSSERHFYSAVFPLHVSENFDAQEIANGLPNVYAVNKMQNINGALTRISHVSLILVGCAYVVVFFILIIVYKFNEAVRIIRAPVLACFFIASVFGYCGMDFNFFAIVGVILTLGIGIDYALFFREGGRDNLTTTLAVILSVTTTLVSFGSLVFSEFTPVKTFGLSVLLGILCCFLLSPLSAKR